MKLYRVFVYWICDDPELGHGERGLDTIFKADDDSSALDFGKVWAEDRTKNLTDVFYIKDLCCVKIARWFPGGFLKDGTLEAGGGIMPFFEWKYDWMPGFTFPVAIITHKERIQAQEAERFAKEARWFNRWANRWKGWKWKSS